MAKQDKKKSGPKAAKPSKTMNTKAKPKAKAKPRRKLTTAEKISIKIRSNGHINPSPSRRVKKK